MEDLIVRYLKGEAAPEEAMKLDEWKGLNESNKELFRDFERVFNLSHGLSDFQDPDLLASWEAIRSRLTVDQENKANGKIRYLRLAMAAAAFVGIILMIGFLFRSPDPQGPSGKKNIAKETPKKNQELLLESGEKEKYFELDDHSRIRLSAGSSVHLDDHYGQRDRKVSLKGSASFEVEHDEEKPFMVQVREMEVWDLGTVFHITTKDDTVKVLVEEGSVQLKLNSQVLDMAAGDSAFYVISSSLISRYAKPDQRQDVVFRFDGTNLSEVADVLGKFFHRKIRVMNPEIEKCPLSVTFKNEDLATILNIIKELLDVEIKQEKDQIGIYGKACN